MEGPFAGPFQGPSQLCGQPLKVSKWFIVVVIPWIFPHICGCEWNVSTIIGLELVQKFTSPFGINYKQSADPETFSQAGHFFIFRFFTLWIKTPANDISRIDALISQCTCKLTWWKCQILYPRSICISASFHCRNTGWLSNTLIAREKTTYKAVLCVPWSWDNMNSPTYVNA